MEKEIKNIEEFEIKNDNYTNQIDNLKLLAEQIIKHEKENINNNEKNTTEKDDEYQK